MNRWLLLMLRHFDKSKYWKIQCDCCGKYGVVPRHKVTTHGDIGWNRGLYNSCESCYRRMK